MSIIYHWDSLFFSSYGSGSILAVGKDVEEAKAYARKRFVRWQKEHPRQKDQDTHWETETFEKDLEGTTTVNRAFFIHGSD